MTHVTLTLYHIILLEDLTNRFISYVDGVPTGVTDFMKITLSYLLFVFSAAESLSIDPLRGSSVENPFQSKIK